MSKHNMTALKREARNDHINEEGRTERRNIFATIVLDVLELTNYELDTDKVRTDDYEEAWTHNSKNLQVLMEKTRSGGYRVYTLFNDDTREGEKTFGFSQKKHAESEMLTQLENHA